jgi:cell wall-associated NlpC family hydrolase
MTHQIHTSLRRRLGRTVRAAVLAVAATTGALAFVGGEASASERLATNALAPFVTSSARQALDSYDRYEATNDVAAYRSYVWFRTETARLAATELGYPVLDMVYAWSVTTLDHQRAVLAAMTQVGVPYRRNTSAEGVGFDCSGLTTFAWQEPGLELFRQSGVQIEQAARLDRSTAKAGDLVQYPGHVMMYLGVGDAIIHSVQTGRTVELDEISPRRSSSVRFGDPTL